MKRLAQVFGVVFILVGVLGFVPGLTTAEGNLLGIFHVDGMHNVVHLLSGAVALISAMGAATYARLYFKVFGVIYALVAVLGFVMADGMVLGMMMNMADNVLHLVIAAVALYAGFGMKDNNPAVAGAM